jgi:hypothetical protein
MFGKVTGENSLSHQQASSNRHGIPINTKGNCTNHCNLKNSEYDSPYVNIVRLLEIVLYIKYTH